MNANDKTEKVLREIHIMLSKAEPYKRAEQGDHKQAANDRFTC